MKQRILLLTLMLFSGWIFAQTPAPPAPATPPASEEQPLAELFNWVLGQWEGEGLMAGNQEFIGSMKATRELDDQAVMIMRESQNKAGGPAGGRKEIMVIGFEGATKKILLTVHASNNTTSIYSGELKDHEIVFSLVIPAPQAGYTNRRIFKQLPDGGLSFVIETGSPEKAVGKSVEINFKKKA